ncbi:hypothetical protein GA0070622_4249 [Micromonospora sediminicola]|uniref:Uncharacterized protein n=1 Tax=Micromonospora sediminicola TaxID=946078 RepID=A0A1A9BCG8_9ACTN|nr:hypothetical protein GA0070622_4249 [Micromonospora sediminicola]
MGRSGGGNRRAGSSRGGGGDNAPALHPSTLSRPPVPAHPFSPPLLPVPFSPSPYPSPCPCPCPCLCLCLCLCPCPLIMRLAALLGRFVPVNLMIDVASAGNAGSCGALRTRRDPDRPWVERHGCEIGPETPMVFHPGGRRSVVRGAGARGGSTTGCGRSSAGHRAPGQRAPSNGHRATGTGTTGTEQRASSTGPTGTEHRAPQPHNRPTDQAAGQPARPRPATSRPVSRRPGATSAGWRGRGRPETATSARLRRSWGFGAATPGGRDRTGCQGVGAVAGVSRRR